jgi:hypothetical protein
VDIQFYTRPRPGNMGDSEARSSHVAGSRVSTNLSAQNLMLQLKGTALFIVSGPC